MSKKFDDQSNIVIVGGGAAGLRIARDLSAKLDASKYNLILINPRPYHIHMPAGARLTTSDEGHLEDTAFIPYDKAFVNGAGTLKVGTVTAISNNKREKGGVLTLQDGESLPYEILVLASGSTFEGALAFPDEKDGMSEWLKRWRGRYERANHIVFVGGGAVGIESAGEVKDKFPVGHVFCRSITTIAKSSPQNKRVTIVQGGNMLLNETYPDKVRHALDKSLKKRGVEIIYNDYIDAVPAEGVVGVTTRKGKKLNTDLVVNMGALLCYEFLTSDHVQVLTRGPRPNTGFISTLGSDVLTERGRTVKVKPTLQLVSHDNIYAAGDIIEWAEQKQAIKTLGQAPVVVANILSSLAGKPPTARYKGSIEMIVVTNGKVSLRARLGVGVSSNFPLYFDRTKALRTSAFFGES